jgi:hypothetical protein
MSRLSRLAAPFAAATALLVSPALVQADITYSVIFDDPGGSFSAYYDLIESHTLAAGAAWASNLVGDASLEVLIRFDDGIPRATGRSMTSSFVRSNGTYNVFEQGAAAELRTGIDPNGSTADIEFTFNSDYLANELWFDTDPVSRTATVPVNRTDAVSVFLHEFGHAFAFNGWLDLFTGTHPGDYESTFDELVDFDGSDFYFLGTWAVALYGGPVPLTYGNYHHFGNNSPRPGQDLIPDLMNGVVFFRGERYDISPLDLAVLADVGLSIVPEPSALALSVVGAGLLAGVYRRCRSRQVA